MKTIQALTTLFVLGYVRAQDDKFLGREVDEERSSSDDVSGKITTLDLDDLTRPLCENGECIGPLTATGPDSTSTEERPLDTQIRVEVNRSEQDTSESGQMVTLSVEDLTDPLCADGGCINPNNDDGAPVGGLMGGSMGGSMGGLGDASATSMSRQVDQDKDRLCAEGSLDCVIPPPEPERDPRQPESDKVRKCNAGDRNCMDTLTPDERDKKLCADGTYGCHQPERQISWWDEIWGEEDGAASLVGSSLVLAAAVCSSALY